MALTQSIKKTEKKNIFNIEIFSFIQYSYMKYKKKLYHIKYLNQSHKNIIKI